MKSCKNPKTFRMMGCMTWFYTVATSVVLVIMIVMSFMNKADAWTIVRQFIYLFSACNIGTALGTLLFSYASFLDCDCDLE